MKITISKLIVSHVIFLYVMGEVWPRSHSLILCKSSCSSCKLLQFFYFLYKAIVVSTILLIINLTVNVGITKFWYSYMWILQYVQLTTYILTTFNMELSIYKTTKGKLSSHTNNMELVIAIKTGRPHARKETLCLGLMNDENS